MKVGAAVEQILGRSDRGEVIRGLDMLVSAFEKFINGGDAPVHYIDGLMAVHNFYRTVIENMANTIVEERPELPLRDVRGALYDVVIATLEQRKALEMNREDRTH